MSQFKRHEQTYRSLMMLFIRTILSYGALQDAVFLLLHSLVNSSCLLSAFCCIYISYYATASLDNYHCFANFGRFSSGSMLCMIKKGVLLSLQTNKKLFRRSIELSVCIRGEISKWFLYWNDLGITINNKCITCTIIRKKTIEIVSHRLICFLNAFITFREISCFSNREQDESGTL